MSTATVEIALGLQAEFLKGPLTSAQTAVLAQFKAAGNDLGAREKRDILSFSDVSAMFRQRYGCTVYAAESVWGAVDEIRSERAVPGGVGAEGPCHPTSESLIFAQP